jgi:hypothetical protein
MASIKNEIVPARLAIKSMMDSGYKNAAYALAELMDNSIQAKATDVELLCIEKRSTVEQRSRDRVESIAVLDNGVGMPSDVLELALQFGNGTRLDQENHTGMGKFGMGLPSASISQARKVEVWSWQGGVDSAMYTYLDVHEIISGEMSSIPTPEKKSIPEEWLKVGKHFDKTGTLVVWSGLDRCIWKTGEAIISNSEFLIGRMYRKFLNNDKVKIRMATFDGDAKARTQKFEKFAKPNDPLYLMSGTSTPAPYNDEPMFEPYPALDNYETIIPIKFNGSTHNVVIRTSMAKLAARGESSTGGLAGNQAYGQHASKNIGVSVLRAGRELELDLSWANWGERKERWWGLEIEFPPALDELFGVTNNKQYASHFAEMSKVDIEEVIKSRNKSSYHELEDDLEDEGDPTIRLLKLAAVIRNKISDMQKVVHAQNVGQRREKKIRDLGFGAEKEATDKTRERQKEGFKGESDAGESNAPDVRKGEIAQALIDNGLIPKQAETFANQAVDNALKYLFVEAGLDSHAFFSVQSKGGAIMLTLNTNHAAYKRLVDVLEKESADESDVEVLKERLNNALDGLKLLLMAWARYEDEQASPAARERAQDARQDWGRMARRFLEQDEE